MNESAANVFAQLWARAEEQERIAGALAEQYMQNPKGIPERLKVAYRCAQRRCLLFTAVDAHRLDNDIEQGAVLIVGQPYRLSRQRSEETSTPEGRARNTFDGERKWKPSHYFLPEDTNVTAACKHIDTSVPSAQIIDDLKHRKGTVTIHR